MFTSSMPKAVSFKPALQLCKSFGQRRRHKAAGAASKLIYQAHWKRRCRVPGSQWRYVTFVSCRPAPSVLIKKCVPERLLLKQEVISQLDSLAAEDTIIASNSSSYSCSEILKGLILKHDRRVLSAHTCKLPALLLQPLRRLEPNAK